MSLLRFTLAAILLAALPVGAQAQVACWDELPASEGAPSRVRTNPLFADLDAGHFPRVLVPAKGPEQLEKGWRGRFLDDQGHIYTKYQAEGILSAWPKTADLVSSARDARIARESTVLFAGRDGLACNRAPDSEACEVAQARAALVSTWVDASGRPNLALNPVAAVTLVTSSPEARREADLYTEAAVQKNRDTRKGRRNLADDDDYLMIEALCTFNSTRSR